MIGFKSPSGNALAAALVRLILAEAITGTTIGIKAHQRLAGPS